MSGCCFRHLSQRYDNNVEGILRRQFLPNDALRFITTLAHQILSTAMPFFSNREHFLHHIGLRQISILLAEGCFFLLPKIFLQIWQNKWNKQVAYAILQGHTDTNLINLHRCSCSMGFLIEGRLPGQENAPSDGFKEEHQKYLLYECAAIVLGLSSFVFASVATREADDQEAISSWITGLLLFTSVSMQIFSVQKARDLYTTIRRELGILGQGDDKTVTENLGEEV